MPMPLQRWILATTFALLAFVGASPALHRLMPTSGSSRRRALGLPESPISGHRGTSRCARVPVATAASPRRSRQHRPALDDPWSSDRPRWRRPPRLLSPRTFPAAHGYLKVTSRPPTASPTSISASFDSPTMRDPAVSGPARSWTGHGPCVVIAAGPAGRARQAIGLLRYSGRGVPGSICYEPPASATGPGRRARRALGDFHPSQPKRHRRGISSQARRRPTTNPPPPPHPPPPPPPPPPLTSTAYSSRPKRQTKLRLDTEGLGGARVRVAAAYMQARRRSGL